MKYLVVIIIGLLSLFYIFSSEALAQLGVIDASVKISICGNGIIEGGEDCEGSDLGGRTCQSLGYSYGLLKCDIACSFDTYGCVPINTPSPSISPSVSEKDNLSVKSTESSSSEINELEPMSLDNILVQSLDSESRNETYLDQMHGETPKPLQRLGFVNWALIPRDSLDQIIVYFISLKRSASSSNLGADEGVEYSCDFNDDGICSLKDLSILLYYVEKYED